MQDGGQDGAADHDVGQSVGIVGAETLSICFTALPEVVVVARLIDASQEGGAEESDGIRRGLESESELQLRCEWHGVAIIDRVEVGDETQDALLLLSLFLLSGESLQSRELRSPTLPLLQSAAGCPSGPYADLAGG